MTREGFGHRERFWEHYPSGWTDAGENVAYEPLDGSLRSTISTVHRRLMASSSHRATILEPAYTHAGVGVVVDDGAVWVTVNYMGHPDRAAQAADDSSPFIDVDPSSVHGEAILRMADDGVLSGYTDGTFRPGKSVTRGQLATLLVRLLDLEASGSVPSFSDVPSDHPHAEAIGIVASHGIVGGYGDGTYRPGASLARGQAATMLVRGFGVPDATGPHGFSDVPDSHVHAAGIAAAAEHGVVGGFNDGTFRPGSSLTRGQIASLLARLRD
jgi:hypothetical protein